MWRQTGNAGEGRSPAGTRPAIQGSVVHALTIMSLTLHRRLATCGWPGKVGHNPSIYAVFIMLTNAKIASI